MIEAPDPRSIVALVKCQAVVWPGFFEGEALGNNSALRWHDAPAKQGSFWNLEILHPFSQARSRFDLFFSGQAVLPDPQSYVACVRQVQVFGDPVLPHRGSLTDRLGARHFAPIALRSLFLGRFVAIEVSRFVGEDADGPRFLRR